jgi:DNA polymerase-1
LKDLEARLHELAPQRPGCLDGVSDWNWNSPAQVKEALALIGHKVETTTDDALAAVDHPLAGAVRDYRAAKHHVSHYGIAALRWVAVNGRVYASWNPLGNDAGRSSCKEPNLQGIHRGGGLRRCFVAPPGRVLVKADFSQAHLRIAAKMANEKVMAEAYRKGQDLHTLMASKITGKASVTKEERQLAKAVNFGLLYAMSAKGLRAYAKSSYGVDMTPDQAERARRAYFELFPALRRWHRRIATSKPTETRSLIGRRRLCDDKTWLGDRLSSPVLGTEADALKGTLALLWERRHEVPGAFPVLVVHDEIVVEADESQADGVSVWLRQAMLDGMSRLIAPVPVEVEVKVARTWGGD